MQAIQQEYNSLFNRDNPSRPNSFSVKLDVLSEARSYWLSEFSCTYDVSVLWNDVEMEGVTHVSVNSDSLRLQSDQLVVEEFKFTEILQIAQEAK